MNSKKNIIVVSARRSGTHLLTDLIVNNFGYESINYNYIDYPKFTDEMPIFESSMDEGNKITWTHSHDYKDYHKFNHTIEDQTKLDRYFSESKIILVYRDIRDIITSVYQRPKIKSQFSSFDDFYQNYDFKKDYELIDQSYENLFELLLQYYKNWFSVYLSRELLDLDIEIISFKDIVEQYNATIGKIGNFLEQPVSNIVDIRLPNKGNNNIVYTTNDFRKGITGDWVNTLDLDEGIELGDRYYRDLGAGLECFINDIKIHKFHQPERDKFQLNFKDWKSIDAKIDKELKPYKNILPAISIDIEKRYEEATGRSKDFRYIHKVFHFDDKILKFIYPCKATVDRKTFEYVMPTASKEVLLTVLKTNKFLYDSGITPKLYHAGIYKGVLYAMQERYPVDSLLYEKYNFYPKWGDWNWVVDMGFHTTMLNYFYKALDNNIILTDLFNVSNCAIDKNGTLKYVDLDGIEQFDSKQEMMNSEHYKNAMGILTEINNYYNKKNGKDNSK